ncbi:MAG: hypothetical protein ACREA0_02415 [bacterium]
MDFDTLLSRLLLVGDIGADDARYHEDRAGDAWQVSVTYYQHVLYLVNLRAWMQTGAW